MWFGAPACSGLKHGSAMKYPEQAKAFLLADIREMSENPGRFAKTPAADFSRKRKLDFEGLVHFLISMGSGSTGHELLEYFDYSLTAPSGSAFCQQRKKLLPSVFSYLLHRFNSHFPPDVYKGKYRLVACDGSEFNIARNPDDPDTFHPPSGKSTKGFNMLHVVSLYDILGKRYLDCVVQPGRKKNEYRAICDMVDRYICEGIPIFIADRGFPSYNFYAHAQEKGSLFLVRVKDVNMRRILGVGEIPNSVDADVEIIMARTQSKKKMKQPDFAERYRYVCSSVSFDYIAPGSDDEYSLSLRVVRFEIADGIFENIVTNLPAEEFPADELKRLYHLRWDIETSFRDLKHTIGAINFHSKKPEYIELEIWARMILFNFCAVITAHVVIAQKGAMHVYQVNFAMAIKICHHFVKLRESRPPPDVESLIGSFTLPIRLGRNYARQHRFRLPAGFCYRFS